jgi:hypothetical protein
MLLVGDNCEPLIVQLDANHWDMACQMVPHPRISAYHKAFLKHYLDLLLFRQQYSSMAVPQSADKSLSMWVHKQVTYIRFNKLHNTHLHS